MRRVRFRTLGCYPLTGRYRLERDTLDAIVAKCETVGRLGTAGACHRSRTNSGSMEKKKREGYF